MEEKKEEVKTEVEEKPKEEEKKEAESENKKEDVAQQVTLESQIKDESNKLPTLNDDETSKSMEVMNPGYLYGTSNDKRVARYQMRCKLIYEKKEEKYKLWH